MFQIVRLSVRSCSVYTSCSSCVLTSDPLACGWCEGHCSTEAECTSNSWRSDRCPPQIQQVNMSSIVTQYVNMSISYNQRVIMSSVKCLQILRCYI